MTSLMASVFVAGLTTVLATVFFRAGDKDSGTFLLVITIVLLALGLPPGLWEIWHMQ